MAIPIERLPLDSDPPVPKPGGTHVLGTNCDMRHSSGLADKWARHLRNGEGVHQEPLETIDNEVTDDLGNVRLCTPAAAPGRHSSHASGYNHVDDREPGPEHTRTPTSPFLVYEPCFYHPSRKPLLRTLSQELAIIEEVKKHLRGYHGCAYTETSRSRRHDDALASVLVKMIRHHRLQQDPDVLDGVLIRTVENHRQTRDLDMLASGLVKLLGYHSPLLAGQHPAASPALSGLASNYAKPTDGLGYALTGSSCHLNYCGVTMDNNVQDLAAWNVLVVARGGDTNILALLHTILVVLMSYLIRHLQAISYQEKVFYEPKQSAGPFTPPGERPARPLTQDFAMRGQLYTEDYFLNNWFQIDKIDEDEKYFKLASWQQLTTRPSYGSSCPHQGPYFTAYVLQNKCTSYANTIRQGWEVKENHAPIQPRAQQARQQGQQARFLSQDENNLSLQNSWIPVL